MITRIKLSAADREKIRETIVQPSAPSDGFLDYSNVAVKKPWGYEYMIFQNQTVAIWVLHIQYAFQTSMHCHPMKQTSIIVLSGEVLCSTLNGTDRLLPGQGLLLEKGVFHSTKAVSPAEAVVMEVETPIDKKDLVRSYDKYGRSGQAYEGVESHVSFETLGLDGFHENGVTHSKEKRFGQSRLVILKLVNDDEFQREIRALKGSIVILRGQIFGRSNRCLFKDGDAVTLDALTTVEQCGIRDEIDVLVVNRESE